MALRRQRAASGTQLGLSGYANASDRGETGSQPPSSNNEDRQMTKDIRDIGEKELIKLYAEYQEGLGRPVPAVIHRQGRSIPGCVSAEARRGN